MADPLSRREREIMDIVYRLGEAPVAEVRGQMAEPPSYSTVRALIGTLVKKGHLRHRQDGTRYLYTPTVPREVARRSALGRVVDAFFGGSAVDAATALLSDTDLDDAELDRLRALIAQAEA